METQGNKTSSGKGHAHTHTHSHAGAEHSHSHSHSDADHAHGESAAKAPEKASGAMTKAIYALLGILVLLVLLNSALTAYLAMKLDARIAMEKEAARPASLSVFVLGAGAACPDCFPLNAMVSQLTQQKVNATLRDVAALSQEAAGLPAVGKLPAIIVSGETSKTPELASFFSSAGFVPKGGYMVLETPTAPYYDVAEGRVRGIVAPTVLFAPASCSNCVGAGELVRQLTYYGIRMSAERNLTFGSAEEASAIAKYNVTILPAILLSDEISAYGTGFSVGKPQADGKVLFEPLSPVYYDVRTAKPVGELSLTFVADQSCSECYNVSRHLAILAGYGVTPVSAQTLDISSAAGREFVSKYNVTRVPTFTLSSGASFYASLGQVWPSVGTVEADGTYVFRNVGVMGKYKNLINGTVIAGQG